MTIDNYSKIPCWIRIFAFLYFSLIFFLCRVDNSSHLDGFRSDCWIIHRDIGDIIDKYNDCSSDYDCIFVSVHEKCVSECELVINSVSETMFREEVERYTQRKCLQKGYCCFPGYTKSCHCEDAACYCNDAIPSHGCVAGKCRLIIP